MDNRKLMVISLFISVAIILSYVERMIPTPFLVAGAKLGLANIVTLISLKLMDKKSAWIILIVRISIVSMMFAGFSGFLYSFAGGNLAYIGMLVMLKLNFKDVSLIGVSVVGATMHSLGQVLVASLLFQNMMILTYLPMLLLTALITGVFVGIIANNLTERLKYAKVI